VELVDRSVIVTVAVEQHFAVRRPAVVIAWHHQDRNVGGEFGFDLLVFSNLSMVGEVATDEDRVESAAAKVAHDPPSAGQRPRTTVEMGVADMRDDHHMERIVHAAP
jgi:hypothetical protein